MGRRRAQYQRLLGASISKGAVINTRGSVGDGSDWYTGILVYWYFVYTGIQSTQEVIISTLLILWVTDFILFINGSLI